MASPGLEKVGATPTRMASGGVARLPAASVHLASVQGFSLRLSVSRWLAGGFLAMHFSVSAVTAELSLALRVEPLIKVPHAERACKLLSTTFEQALCDAPQAQKLKWPCLVRTTSVS